MLLTRRCKEDHQFETREYFKEKNYDYFHNKYKYIQSNYFISIIVGLKCNFEKCGKNFLPSPTEKKNLMNINV